MASRLIWQMPGAALRQAQSGDFGDNLWSDQAVAIDWPICESGWEAG